jgi:hypothetical protein
MAAVNIVALRLRDRLIQIWAARQHLRNAI